MDAQKYEIGMVGLGVMGRNMLLNMADHGVSVAGYDKDTSRLQLLSDESEHSHDIYGAKALPEFVDSLRTPRAVMMLVPAGPIVDAVIHDLLPHLAPGDIVIDGGNSYFKDTELRERTLAERKIAYLGVGISGGEHGARYGPSMMPGGDPTAYERIRPVFEAVAAKVNGEPCVAYMGPHAAGHYVKMVHNGIEYGLMELIAETYDLMKRGLGMSDDEMAEVFEGWNSGRLNSYLLEITGHILRMVDPKTSQRLVDEILDAARQKGTGKWTAEDAMDLQVPTPTVDIAVAMRDMSILKEQRVAASKVLDGPDYTFDGDHKGFVEKLGNALYAGMIITFAQGMAQLQAASRAYGYNLREEDIARIWRGGCIIRAALLENIRVAYRRQPDLPNLMLDPDMARDLQAAQGGLRAAVSSAAAKGIPAPALMACLAYFDGYRSGWLPANLIQAQRDYFGAHTYERTDTKGTFHTEWVLD